MCSFWFLWSSTSSYNSSSTQPLHLELLTADFVFDRDDDSKPPLSPLYRGPYKALKRLEKFVILQIGDKSVDRLKAVFSSVPVTPISPPQGRPCWNPASVPEPPVHMKKKVQFETLGPVPLDGSRFSASLRHPPASPSGGSNCGY